MKFQDVLAVVVATLSELRKAACLLFTMVQLLLAMHVRKLRHRDCFTTGSSHYSREA